MKKRSLQTIAALSALMLMLNGCGSSGADTQVTQSGDDTEVAEETQNADNKDTPDPADTSSAADTAVSSEEEASPMEEMVGKWVYICSLYHVDYEDGDTYDGSTSCKDEYYPDTAVIVRKEGDTYKADFKYKTPETDHLIYGSELEFKDVPAYKGCLNQEWCAELKDPFMDVNSTVRRLTMDRGMLIESEEYFGEEDYPFYSVTANIYLPEGSDKLNDPDNLLYFDTVTVSDAEELLNSVQNNRKIILKSGRYDLSGVAGNAIDNEQIGKGYGSYTFNNVYNLCIEAEEGADVLICVKDPYDPVMWFENCGNIALKGLTVGHDVEPGYCSGSVLYYNQVTGVDIDDCNLYGCGTYGLEAYSCYDVNVTDTDIYECTYGLISLSSVGSVYFKDCTLRDSSDMDMINVYSGYDVSFENCVFKNNRITWDMSYFVNLDEYSNVAFRSCSFDNNEYQEFSKKEVEMSDCTIDGKKVSYSNLAVINGPEDIKTLYDNAAARDQEILDSVNSGDHDQETLNQLSYEEYELWDSLLNGIWGYMAENLDEETMNAARSSQKQWIKEKEEAVKAAGANFEGGSMQPMLEYGTGARLTRERVELLMEQYLNNQ